MRRDPEDTAYKASPRSQPLRPQGRYLQPGPTRRFDRRHWYGQERYVWFFMLMAIAMAVWFLGVHLRFW